MTTMLNAARHPGVDIAQSWVKLQSFCKKEVGQTKPFHIHLAVKKGKDEDDPERRIPQKCAGGAKSFERH
jgi:hypothetical protein